MNLRSLFWTTLLASAGALVYGALVESNRLVVERRRLRLRAWPKSFSGFTIALLADLHLRDEWSVRLANEACRAAVECEPDLILIAGDFLGHWANESAPYDEMFMAAIGPLSVYRGRVFAVPGNHDYVVDDISVVVQGCRELGIRLLRNEAACCDGVQIVGVDSRNAHRALPHVAMALANPELPTLALWHEPRRTPS